VLDAHTRLKALSSAEGPSRVDRNQIIEAFNSFATPAGLCPGSSELRVRLEALWSGYEPAGTRWERSASLGKGGLVHRHLADGGAQIWKRLLPFHERLPTLHVYLVDYPAPAVLAVAPLTCVIAPATGDRHGFAGQVTSAAEALAAN
jgi:hypothetical protein